MKLNSSAWAAGIAVAALSFGFLIPVDAQTRFGGQVQGSSVKIKGTSTTHDWEMEGKLIGGVLEFGDGVKLDPAQATIAGVTGGKVPIKAHAVIPVGSVHSKAEHMPDVMDHLMEKTLLMDQFPRIEYTLTEMTFKGNHAAGKPFDFDTTGTLSIAGVTNKVSFPITIEVVDPKTLKLQASVPLKMTDFKMDPPAPNIGLGLMKCGDGITIVIDWTLINKQAK